MFYVYILKSVRYSKFYTGYTDNLEKRLFQHNQGQGTYSGRYKPWQIVYSETYDSQQKAIAREHYLKSAAGRRWLKRNIRV